MRAELDVAGVPRTAPVRPSPPAPSAPSPAGGGWTGSSRAARRIRAVSLWVLALDLFQVVAHGRVWTGTDGVYLVDQMQYLAWIQSASHHLLSANLFVLRGTPADYLQPAVAISAALTALGVAPVAVAAAVEADRGRWRHSSASTCTCAGPSTASGRAARRSCWRCSSARSRSSRGRSGSSGTCSRGSCRGGTRSGCWRSALMVFALLAYDRARRGARGARVGRRAAGRGRWRAAPVAGRAADPDRAGHGDRRLAWHAPPRPTGLPAGDDRGDRAPARLLPAPRPLRRLVGAARDAEQARVLVLDARARARAAADRRRCRRLRRRPRSFLETLTRVWPLAARRDLPAVRRPRCRATPLHAFEGITLPAVGARRTGSPAAWASAGCATAWRSACVAVAVFTIPTTYWELHNAEQLAAPQHRATPTSSPPASATRSATSPTDRDARRRARRASTSGPWCPARPDRRTFVGDCLWSEPNCSRRAHPRPAVARRDDSSEVGPASS